MADEPLDESGSARSIDGRMFECELPAHSTLVAGDLVVLSLPGGGSICGQLLHKAFQDGRCIGAGAVVGKVEDGSVGFGSVEPFSDADLAEASADIHASIQAAASAAMPVGTTRHGQAMLRSKGFSRHTFMCGQSGSGKSYALGVLLEQVLLDTDLPMVVLDPNADFIHLSEPLASATEEETGRLGAASTTVLRPHPDDGGLPLRVRFSTLSTESKAAILRLDPLADRDEFHSLLDASEMMRTLPPTEAVKRLMSGDSMQSRMLAQRIENLGVLTWDVWAGETTSAVEVLDKGPRAMVLDLSGFEHHRERLVVAIDLLEHLWANREKRDPRLIVIDEAHNICSAAPTNALELATTERLIQIASEGRKYGLWLLLCTQRPSRIHPSVLSQCDNLVLMKMNSQADLAQLSETFGFVPREMLASSPYFRQGESLMAGGFIPTPSFVRLGHRRTREGGSDVAVPLRSDG